MSHSLGSICLLASDRCYQSFLDSISPTSPDSSDTRKERVWRDLPRTGDIPCLRHCIVWLFGDSRMSQDSPKDITRRALQGPHAEAPLEPIFLAAALSRFARCYSRPSYGRLGRHSPFSRPCLRHFLARLDTFSAVVRRSREDSSRRSTESLARGASRFPHPHFLPLLLPSHIERRLTLTKTPISTLSSHPSLSFPINTSNPVLK